MTRLLNSTDYQPLIVGAEQARRQDVAKALVVLERSGMNRSQAAQTYRTFEPQFRSIAALPGTTRISRESYLATHIARQKALGKSDDVIKSELDAAMRGCK
jgi:hypothetical protein